MATNTPTKMLANAHAMTFLSVNHGGGGMGFDGAVSIERAERRLKTSYYETHLQILSLQYFSSILRAYMHFLSNLLKLIPI